MFVLNRLIQSFSRNDLYTILISLGYNTKVKTIKSAIS